MHQNALTQKYSSLSIDAFRRAVAATAVATAFCAAGVGPPAVAPAHADIEDSIGDLVDPGTLGAVADSADQGALSGAGEVALAVATSFNSNLDQLPASLHTQIEGFITNPDNEWLLDAINFPSVVLFGRDLIGNGIEVGDTIPALSSLSFLDLPSGPFGEVFTGTNEGLLTPVLTSLGVNVGSLHDGGWLFGDSAPANGGVDAGHADSTAHAAQALPPITCAGILTTPDFNGFDVVSGANVSCDGAALIGLTSEIFWNKIPIGIPGIGFGVGSASALTASLGCFPGTYSAGVMEVILAVPPYVFPDPVTFHFTPDVPISCSV